MEASMADKQNNQGGFGQRPQQPERTNTQNQQQKEKSRNTGQQQTPGTGGMNPKNTTGQQEKDKWKK